MNYLKLLICVPLLLLVGCFNSAPPVPRDHYYRISVPTPARSDVPMLQGVVAVAPLEADGLLRERPLLYSASGQSYEMQQHAYHYWSDPPPRMLQFQLIDYLRSSGLANTVIAPDPGHSVIFGTSIAQEIDRFASGCGNCRACGGVWR